MSRELLQNDDITVEEPNKESKERTYRMRMRDRVVTGLHDLAILNQYARSDDIEQIFHRDDTDTRPNGNQYIEDERGDFIKAHWVPAYHGVALFWQGLRANGMDKDDIFSQVIKAGIEKGEAQHKGVSRGAVESDISLNKLKAHKDTDNMGALEKWKRDGMQLTAEEWQELHEQVSNHPDVDDTTGKNLNELIKQHLVESDE